MNVEWDGSGGKPQDIRKEKNRTNSPMHSPARSVPSERLETIGWEREREREGKPAHPAFQVRPDVP